MMTGKEYLKEHIEETNIPEEHYENEIGEIMDWYADDYHQEQVKNLSLSGVVKLFTTEEVLNVLNSSYELIDAISFFEYYKK